MAQKKSTPVVGRAQLLQAVGASAGPTTPAAGQLEPGNIDLTTRPRVQNEDGSISTVRSMSVNFDGQEVLLPTVSDDGRLLSEDEAIQQYLATGKHLGKFDTPDNATAFAESLHNAQEAFFNRGAALTAPTDSLSTTLTGQQAAQTADAARQPVESSIADAQLGFTDKALVAAQESYTGWIGEALARQFEENYGAYDPTFDAASEFKPLAAELGLAETDELFQRLSSAGTREEMARWALQAKRHEQNQEVLARHGGYAIASGLLDPISLIVDTATFGASRAFKLSRIASATMGAAGSTAVTGAADVAGADVSGFDYVLGAALTGGAFGLFGGEAANRIARGQANWYGKPSLPNQAGQVNVNTSTQSGAFGKVKQSINEFTTKFDALRGTGTPERDALLVKLMDDPVRRDGLYTNSSAAAFFRMYDNQIDGLVKGYEDAVDQAIAGSSNMGWFARKVDLNGKFGQTRDAVETDVAAELLRRDAHYQKFGEAPPRNPSEMIAKLADQHDAMYSKMLDLAKTAGLRGFEDITQRSGYFHRQWNHSKMARVDELHGKGTLKGLVSISVGRGLGVGREEADLIATSIIQRARAKAQNDSLDFLGVIGKADTEALREMLEATPNISKARVDSIMGRIEQNLTEKGLIKYSKSRLPLDMEVAIKTKAGGQLRMLDLIDTDLSRLTQNYGQAIAGRSALAKAGIGGDDSAIRAYRTQYANTLRDLPEADQKKMLEHFDDIMGDFTGQRPDRNILGQDVQRVKSIADATMLSASGLWQAAEYSTMAYRYGVVQTAKQMFKSTPGMKQLMGQMRGNPDLADELRTILSIDLARDVRIRPWVRQHDAHVAAADTSFDRVLHFGKQAVPYLNGMKFIHKHQSRMNANLALNTMARAAHGDADALRTVESYGLKGAEWSTVKHAILTNVQMDGKNAKAMGWGGWTKGEIDSAMNAALRIMDDTILFGRVGQGTSFAHSWGGQVLGQFRSFVGFAHNKLLRGTLRNEGVGGMAALMAFQYPLTFMLVTANEVRKGEDVSFDEAGLRKIALKSIGYTSAIGMVGDAAGVLGLTGRGGFSAPIMGLTQAGPRALGGFKDMLEGDFRAGAADVTQAAASVTPFVMAMPGSAALLKALEGDQ